MGYWSTTVIGASLQLFGDLNPDGSEMIWGDAPADCIDTGMDNLIARLKAELGRFPTVAEIDAVKATAPEMTEAIAEAILVFHDDIKRQPTDGEIAAGLLFADTGIALDCAQRRDIGVGDRVQWPVMRDAGFFREIDHIAEGEVVKIEQRQIRSDWSDGLFTRTFLVVRREDSVDDIRKEFARKVLPGDDPVETTNARYRSGELLED